TEEGYKTLSDWLNAPHSASLTQFELLLREFKPEVSLNANLSDDAEASRVYEVWFGTNRRPIDPNDESKGYSGERDQCVHYGVCDVTIPESHKIGSIGSPWWKRLLTLRDDRLKVICRWPLPGSSFWCGFDRALSKVEPAERMVLVFVHGYNVQFDV